MLPGNRRFWCCPAHRERRHNFAAILRLIRRTLGIKACNKSILDFMSIRKDVALVEFQDVSEVVHSGHKAIDRARFDYMLPLSFQETPCRRLARALAAAIPRTASTCVAINRIVNGLPGILSAFPDQPLACNKFHAASDPDAETIPGTKAAERFPGSDQSVPAG